MIILPQSDTLTFPTDSELPTTPSDTKSSFQADKSQGQVSSADSTKSRQDKADFHSDRSQPTIRENKESRYTADSASIHERNRGVQSATVSPASQDQPGKMAESSATKQGASQSGAQPQNAYERRVQEMAPPTKQGGSSIEQKDTGSQSQVPNPHLEAHTPQDGAPSTEQRQASSKPRDAASQSQAPPPEVHKPQEESVREKQGNRPPDTVAAAQSTVPRESWETKQGHPSAGDSKPDGLNERRAQAQTREREPESGRESSFSGEKDRSTGGHSESSNRKKDATSHRL